MSHVNLRTPVRFGLVFFLVLAVMVIPAMADADNSSVPDATVTDADLTVIETVTTPPVTEMATLTETATDVPSPLAVTETVTPTESPTDVITDLLAILTATPTAVVTNAAGSNAATTTEKNTVNSDSINGVLPGYTNIFVKPANDAGIRWDYTKNGTYFINQNGGGLNAVHISTDPAVGAGQVTVSPDQAGTFYVTETGGRGYQDEVVILLAINGTLPDDFSVRLKTSGYTWAPNVTANTAPPSGAYTYQATTLDETFTKNDFVYGPQSWKPQGADAIYPIFFGEDTSSGVNQFQLAFIDTRAGVLGSNYADYASLTDKGAVKVEYSFTNLTGYAAFNLYAWNNATNNGQGMGWTNRVSGDGSSGYSVVVPLLTAAFTVSKIVGPVPLTVQFTDVSTRSPVSWAWDFNGDDVTDSTEQNPSHTFTTAGTYTVKLTVTDAAGATDDATLNITVENSTATGGLATSAWPKFGHDLNNSGQSPYVGSQTGTPKWSYYAGSMSSATFSYQIPVIDTDGIIYICDGYGTLHAIYPDGSIKWQMKKTTAGWSIMGPLAIGSDNILYAGSYDTYVYAIYPENGSIKWKSPATGTKIYGGGPAIGTDGTIYIGSDALYAFDTQGTLKWKNTTGTANYATPAIGLDGTIYIGSQTTGTFYAYNPDGTLKWSNTSGAVKGSAAIGLDGTIYAGSTDTNVYAWNADGTLKWKNTTGGAIVGSPAIGPDGTIYIGNSATVMSLNALNPDGTLKWTYPVLGYIQGTPGIGADGTIYVGTSTGSTHYAINPDGTLKWSNSISGVYGSPVIAADGTVYFACKNKYMYAYPGVVNFSADQTNGLAPLAVQFTGTSPLAVTAWHWDFGDGTTSTDQNPLHTYTPGGTYTINLTITHGNGTNTLVKKGYISAYALPVANFTASATSGVTPLSVTFTDQTTGAPTSWLWEFGDGTTSTEQNPTHIFTTPGSSTTTYTVNLTATNPGGSTTTSKIDYITLYSAVPVISFTASPRVSGAVPLNVQFNDTSTLSPTSWYWDFGDGTNSTEKNPSHIYTAVGSYTVNLTATNIHGSNTLSKPSYMTIVIPGPIPTQNGVNIYVANDEGVKYDINGTVLNYVPNTYYISMSGGLNALSIYDGVTTGANRSTSQSGTFYVTFGGGQATMHNGILMLAVNGTIPDDFSVHIKSSGYNWTMTGGPGTSNLPAPTEYNYVEGAVNETFTKDDFIYGPQIWKPCSEANYPIHNGQDMSNAGNTFRIMFIDLRVGHLKNLVEDWNKQLKVEYSFNNLTSFAVFNDYGWYIASNHGTGIMMTNDISTGGSIMVVGIPAAPVANFTSSTNTSDILSPVQFTDTSANVPQSWLWDFGDGTTSTEQNPVHTYTAGGTFTVNLTVTNYKGTDKMVKPAYIIKDIPAVPVANFTANVTSGVSPVPVQFTDNSTGSIISWYWDFGDGFNSTEQNPLHWYAPGTYSVNLTVSNSGGSNNLLKSSLITVTSNGRNNQFINPGFETGDLTGWTATSAGSATSSINHTGNYSLYTGTSMSIEQHVDLTNIPNISFWIYRPNGGAPSGQHFTLSIDGAGIRDIHATDEAWIQYVIPISHSGVHTVKISYSDGATGYVQYLDDVVAEPPAVTPIAAFTGTPTTGTAPLAVQFNDTSANIPTAWAWDFNNDGTIEATTQNATYTYTAAGTYTVNLTATNAAGSNSLVRNKYISVLEAPADRARLILPAASLYQNNATQLPVQVMNITNGTGISFDLAYDPAVIRVDEITLNQSYESGSNLAVNATPGMIRLSFTRTDGINIKAP
ncbi:MAG: PKD domain-containing protein, partial [Methanoregula sp.]|nr:PKD domain-containing protein [Methanoregula sp.]